MKLLIFTLVVLSGLTLISPAAHAQKLSNKFPEQLQAILAVAKKDPAKLKGKPISAAGEYESKLPLDGFMVIYTDPDDEDEFVKARKAVGTKSAEWMKEITAALKKMPGYTVKDSYKDTDFFTGYRESTKHTVVLLKGVETVLTVIELTQLYDAFIDLWF